MVVKMRIPRSIALILTLALPVLTQAQTFISSLSDITDADGSYIITSDIVYNASTNHPAVATFRGTLDGDGHHISSLSAPLFTTLDGAIVRNINIDDVTISGGTNAGAVCVEAAGASRIYNIGILDGSLAGSGYVGGLVGKLDGSARVVNCYSFAAIAGGTTVGGIVGYNSGTTTAASITTMVMNCMFYGDITGGTTPSPVYGGTSIDNLNSGGLNTFNYYAYNQLQGKTIGNSNYNCALAAEERFLTRFEFHRLMLNSNKCLAAYYATGSKSDSNLMYKWVLDKSIAPYPILKAQGRYPSIINYNTDGLADYDETHRNQGRKTGTLAVTINESNTTSGGQTKPTGATVTTTSLTLVRTDKDIANYNFNYDKVQLPYYNDVGTKNYTGNKVVTGWKITAMSGNGSEQGTYTASDTWGGYNFADRSTYAKDLYSSASGSYSGRIYSQGAYLDVPDGVNAITIEPYWGNAAYLADEYLDVVYNASYAVQAVSQLPKHFPSGKVVIDGSEQTVHKTLANALGALGTATVYDNAIVLVGNFHHSGAISEGTKPFTIMSVDRDNDHEPDCSFIYSGNTRHKCAPLRFDFINVPGTAMMQKPKEAATVRNAAVFLTQGWFEITNTALMYFSQFEYENLKGITKVDSPLILQGGVFDQFVSTQTDNVTGKTIYIHVGGNVWFKSFGMGTHSDGNKSTPHVPVSVTGGDYEGFYLTGTYNPSAGVRTDNAECYISGGRFGEAAGASMEQINGNVQWYINHADINNFYGGGINANKPILGTVTTDIVNSHVGVFCGGPKFGNMASGMAVTTNATNCTFGTFFGAGFGGTALSKQKYYDETSPNFTTYENKYSGGSGDRGKYYDGSTTNANSGKPDYGKKGPGVAVDFDYEFFVWTSGAAGARFFIMFANFSLAKCNDVTSTLKQCTIENNFYGGGSLGAVTGTATSVLESCTVKGNAYGAGFSATLPIIEVRSGGFTKKPNLNKYNGMFEPGELSTVENFQWVHHDFPADGGAGIDESGSKHDVYTDVNLTALGQVENAVLTIKGNSTIGSIEGGLLKDGTGCVYGGGDESAVNGDTEVIIQDNVQVHGDVFGGGKEGAVGGSTHVIIQD